VYKDTSSSYGSVDGSGFDLLGLALCLPNSSVSSVFVVLYLFK